MQGRGKRIVSRAIFQRLALISCDTLFLRHTFCTRMCEQNINIKVLQDVMGHRNIRTTMETYAKAFRDKKVEAVMGSQWGLQDFVAQHYRQGMKLCGIDSQKNTCRPAQNRLSIQLQRFPSFCGVK